MLIFSAFDLTLFVYEKDCSLLCLAENTKFHCGYTMYTSLIVIPLLFNCKSWWNLVLKDCKIYSDKNNGFQKK